MFGTVEVRQMLSTAEIRHMYAFKVRLVYSVSMMLSYTNKNTITDQCSNRKPKAALVLCHRHGIKNYKQKPDRQCGFLQYKKERLNVCLESRGVAHLNGGMISS